ncbi:hypothetical protein [Candidatus Frankia alpina]|uniref:hypothetical protein n=1 Tax=Candidatus Frankia alpina TaxID=2699483 RepID=UPI001A97F977|nr:hypothetical protein [Candidatus Frankia alpina]
MLRRLPPGPGSQEVTEPARSAGETPGDAGQHCLLDGQEGAVRLGDHRDAHLFRPLAGQHAIDLPQRVHLGTERPGRGTWHLQRGGALAVCEEFLAHPVREFQRNARSGTVCLSEVAARFKYGRQDAAAQNCAEVPAASGWHHVQHQPEHRPRERGGRQSDRQLEGRR